MDTIRRGLTHRIDGSRVLSAQMVLEAAKVIATRGVPSEAEVEFVQGDRRDGVFGNHIDVRFLWEEEDDDD